MRLSIAEKTCPIPLVGEIRSRIWGPLEKQLVNYKVIYWFVGGPPSGGVQRHNIRNLKPYVAPPALVRRADANH